MSRQTVWKYLQRKDLDPKKDIVDIIRGLGYTVLSYTQAISAIDGLEIKEDMLKRDGCSVVLNGQRIILYSDNLSRRSANRVLLHELGHFVVNRSFGGNLQEDKDLTTTERMQKEQEANEFVYERIPTPVLYRAGATSREDISLLTQLDNESVSEIWSRVKEYAKKERAFGCQEEAVCGIYNDYIRLQKIELKSKHRRDKLRSIKRRFRVLYILHRGKLRFTITAISVAAIIALAVVADRHLYRQSALDMQTDVTTQGTAAITVAATTKPPTQPITTTETEVTTTTAPTTTTKALQTQLAPGTLVYVTKEGDRYHLPGCYHIRGKENLIEMTVEQAEAAGYEPCKDCVG